MLSYIFSQLLLSVVLFILCYVVIMNGLGIVQMIAALLVTPSLLSEENRVDYRYISSSENVTPISLLCPAYNEEATIVESVRSMLNLNYTNYGIVVINDGSTDKTLDTVISTFNLHKIIYPVRERLATKKVKGIYYNPDIPRLWLIDKENGGKADALNAGINLSRFPYIVTVDADSLLDPDALLHVAAAFLQSKYTIAVGGMIRVANGCTIKDGKILKAALPRTMWALFQANEYIRSFMTGRIGWSILNSLLVISGAFGAFRKEAVVQAGGFSTGTLGEDMDMIIKLHRYMLSKKYKYQISFLPAPVCWTMAPENLGSLFQQRRRWQIGLIEALGRYRDMFFNRRFGKLGMLAVPYFAIFEMLSPIIETAGYVLIPLAWFFGFLSLNGLALFFLAAFGFGAVSSVGSLAVEELSNTKNFTVKEAIILSFLSIAENLFFRQITVFFRLIGIFTYRRQKNTWGSIRRKRFKTT